MTNSQPPQTELAACPFCGDHGGIETLTNYAGQTCYSILCEVCHASAAPELTREEAIAAWNTRPSPLVDTGEALREVREQIINTPETADFMAGVPIEAAHQRERWGSEHDAGKTPFDWFWLVGYLAQKAATAAVAGDAEKAMHHTISTAGALANWHAALSGKSAARHPKDSTHDRP